MIQQNNFTEKLTPASSGVRIYSFFTPVHSFCLSLYIPAGPMYEEANEAGYSHFFEHMIFRNVNTLTGGELYRTLDRFALTMSGTTYNEFVQISIQGAPRHFKTAADLMEKVLSPISVTLSELSRERDRVKREIREDSSRTSVDALCQKEVWKGTGLAETVTGTIGNLSRITLSKLIAYREKILSPQNIFFSLTGAFSESDLSYLKQKADALVLPKGEKRENIAPTPADFFNRAPRIKAKKADYCKVKMSFDLDCALINKPTRDLIYDILFQGDTSRIFLELSENSGFVYSFDANMEEYRNIGALTLSFEVSKNDLLPALKKVKEVFDSMKEELHPELLALAKAPYTENTFFILDDAESLNFNKALESRFLGFNYDTLEQRREAYERVSAEDIREGARRIFQNRNLTVALKAQNPDSAAAAVAEILDFKD